MKRLVSSRFIKTLNALTLLAAISWSSVGTVAAQENDVPDLVERVKPAVVYIVTTIRGKKEMGQGSGFFVRSDQIISNWHVVEDAQSILVKTAQGEILKVKSVVATDRVHDLALLQLETPVEGISTLEIAPSSPREGAILCFNSRTTVDASKKRLLMASSTTWRRLFRR